MKSPAANIPEKHQPAFDYRLALIEFAENWMATAVFEDCTETRGGHYHVYTYVVRCVTEAGQGGKLEHERTELIHKFHQHNPDHDGIFDIRLVFEEGDVPTSAEQLWKNESPMNGKSTIPQFRFHGPVIGLWGPARSGKDTVCDIIQKLRPSTKRIAFADPLKRFCKEVFDLSDDQLWGNSKDKPDRRYPRGNGEFLTPRMALQSLGTEWGRRLYEDTWIDYAFRIINHTFDNVEITRPDEGTHFMSSYIPRQTQMFLISDVRMRNDFESVVRAGGHLVAITRKDRQWHPTEEVARHSSESIFQDQDLRECAHYHLRNDGSLEDLEEKVKAMLTELSL